jgi:nicotinamidase-related amidase
MKVALLIIDMLNPMDFPEGKALSQAALPVAKHILKLKAKIKRQKGIVIYCNDNFDQWDSDKQKILQAAQSSKYGAKIAQLLTPEDADLFVLKPENSAFHNTPLDNILKHYKINQLILTGIAGNLCVLFSAMDAHMRKYSLWVPKDCIASNTKRENLVSLAELKSMKVNISSSTSNYFLNKNK